MHRLFQETGCKWRRYQIDIFTEVVIFSLKIMIDSFRIHRILSAQRYFYNLLDNQNGFIEKTKIKQIVMPCFSAEKKKNRQTKVYT